MFLQRYYFKKVTALRFNNITFLKKVTEYALTTFIFQSNDAQLCIPVPDQPNNRWQILNIIF